MVRTKLHKRMIENSFFTYLKDNINWIDGIGSRRTGQTRKAYPLRYGENTVVDSICAEVLHNLEINNNKLLGVYLNYYRDGDDYCPSHKHDNGMQIIISFGATRTLIVGKKEYRIEDRDVMVFGKSVHSVPKEEADGGRISIALFIKT